MFTAILAGCQTKDNHKYGIGNKGKLPWNIPGDMKHFKTTTLDGGAGSICIMGGSTYRSIVGTDEKKKYNPLPGRDVIVMTHKMWSFQGHGFRYKYDEKKESGIKDSIDIARSVDACIDLCQKYRKGRKVFICGGAQIYKLFEDWIQTYIFTHVKAEYECDTFITLDLFPVRDFTIVSNLPFDEYSIVTYERKNPEEQAYLGLLKDILEKGKKKTGGRNTNSRYLFGRTLRFDLRNGTFPLLTHRNTWLKGVFEELMFYCAGDTNVKNLSSKGVKVWDANTTREALNKRGLEYLPEFDMGPTYGFNMRHFGAEYKDCHTDYTGKGYDQLEYVLKILKTNPKSRHIKICLWDPSTVEKSSLPPCLYDYTFDVSDDGELSCVMNQRSSDFTLAGGWNIATGALLVYMLSAMCKLTPGELIWNIANVHIYENQLEAVEKILRRTPRMFPKLILKNTPVSFKHWDYKNCVTLRNYAPKGKVDVVMNA